MANADGTDIFEIMSRGEVMNMFSNLATPENISNINAQLAETMQLVNITAPKYGADPTGKIDSTTAIQNAINDASTNGYVVYLPSGVYLVNSSLTISTKGIVIVGCGANTVIQLNGDFTLFNLTMSDAIIKDFKIIVPISNVNPAILVSSSNGMVTRNKVELYFDTVGGTQGTYTAIQTNINGNGLYDNYIKANILNAGTGCHISGTASGFATGNTIEFHMVNVATGFVTDTIDFSNNKIIGQFQTFLSSLSFMGVHLLRGWGNKFEVDFWDDSTADPFINYQFDSGCYFNLIDGGHMEGQYIDNDGRNIVNVWYRQQNKSTGMSVTVNRYKMDNFYNMLRDGSFESINPFTVWIGGGSGGVPTLTQDTTYTKNSKTSMKITRSGTTSGWSCAYQSLSARYVAGLKGKYVTIGAWVMCPTSNVNGGRILIEDSSNDTFSDLVPKDGNWHWVTATRQIASSATSLTVQVGSGATTDTVGANDVIYVDGFVAVVGAFVSSSFIPNIKEIMRGTPPSPTALGNPDEITIDDNNFYLYASNNKWKKTPLYNDRKMGTAQIGTGGTSVTVTHGLNGTPTNFNVTALGNIGYVWVSGQNSSTFVINCSNAAPSPANVSWEASL